MAEIEKILISACLLGKKVRYDGNGLSIAEESVADKILNQWREEGRLVAVCPEVDAGMSIPRAPAEILSGSGGGVLAGSALVVESKGNDVSEYFIKGARIALDLCIKHNIKMAVLTENSPSCGSSFIYDGSFTNKKIEGLGVTAALLIENDIDVFSQHDIELANSVLQRSCRFK